MSSNVTIASPVEGCLVDIAARIKTELKTPYLPPTIDYTGRLLDIAPAYSEEALALEFANIHVNDLRQRSEVGMAALR